MKREIVCFSWKLFNSYFAGFCIKLWANLLSDKLAPPTDADNNNDDEMIICVLNWCLPFSTFPHCETMELSRVVHLWQSSPTVLLDDGRYDNSNACKARISIRRWGVTLAKGAILVAPCFCECCSQLVPRLITCYFRITALACVVDVDEVDEDFAQL